MKEKHWFMSMVPVRKAIFWLVAVFMVGGVLFSLSYTLHKSDDSEDSVNQAATFQAGRVNGLKQRYMCYDVIVEAHRKSALLWHFNDKLNFNHLDQMGTIKLYQTKSVLRL